MAENRDEKVKEAKPWWKTWLNGIALAAVVAVAVCLILPITVSTNHRMPATFCRLNLQQCYCALRAYVDEHGGVFPKFGSETDWVQCARPYLPYDEVDRLRLLHCPGRVDESRRSGGCLRCRRDPPLPGTDYAFNMSLCGLKLADARPEEKLLMETRSFGHGGSPMAVTVKGQLFLAER